MAKVKVFATESHTGQKLYAPQIQFQGYKKQKHQRIAI